MVEPRRPRQRAATRTLRGHGDPASAIPAAGEGEPEEPDGAERDGGRATERPAPFEGTGGRRRTSPLEVVTVFERREGTLDPTPWRAVEIWTRNRVYCIDSRLVCIEVIDRVSGQPERHHVLLGARLSGGQRREGSRVTISHPFPVPGTEAVFKHLHRKAAFGQTSRVERVVLRVRVSELSFDATDETWAHITGDYELPKA